MLALARTLGGMYTCTMSEAENLVTVSVRVPGVVYRRFSAWCRLHGLKIQEVIADFMQEKGEQMTPVEDPKILFHRERPPEEPGRK